MGLPKTITTERRADGDREPRAVRYPAKDLLRIVFGVIWLVDAVLKWQPGFHRGYMDQLMGQAQGQPGWLHGWFQFWINLQHPHPYVWAYLVAALETLIALALIFGFARKLTYVGAIVLSLLIWATAEGFGGPYTAGTSDVGTAIIYALVFAGLLLLNDYDGPAHYSVDRYLEARWSWWWHVAEVRRPVDKAVPYPVDLTSAAGQHRDA